MLFNIRKECCICKNQSFVELLDEDYEISPSLNLFETDKTSTLIPYNIIECKKCNISFSQKGELDRHMYSMNYHIKESNEIGKTEKIKSRRIFGGN